MQEDITALTIVVIVVIVVVVMVVIIVIIVNIFKPPKKIRSMYIPVQPRDTRTSILCRNNPLTVSCITSVY